MPEEHTTPDLVERLERLAHAINARDFDMAVSVYTPDAVFHPRTGVVGALQGRGAIRGFFEEWFGAYDQFETEIGEVREFGHGLTFAVISMRGRLPGTTNWVSDRYAFVSTWTDGLIERVTNYFDFDEARAAAERLARERCNTRPTSPERRTDRT
jgi:ketosteroid isomerase-like protein